MLITTSRRPGRLARAIGREFATVIPKSDYLPRGSKPVERVAAAARSRGQKTVLIVESSSRRAPGFRFIEVGNVGWRWLDAMVELGEVKLRRGNRRDRSKDLKIYSEGKTPREFAEWIGKLFGAATVEKLPAAGVVVLVTSDDGIGVRFKVFPNDIVGPAFRVTAFGNLPKDKPATE